MRDWPAVLRVPLIVAVVVVVLIPFTFGAAIVAMPVSLALWVVIASQAGWWRDNRPGVLRAALAVNLVLAFLLVVTISIVIHHPLV